MERLTSFVRICVTVVNSVSDSSVTLLAALLDLNYRFVSLLANLICCLGGITCSIFSDSCVVIKCLAEDFVLFARDIGAGIDKLSDGIISLICLIVACSYDIILALGNGAVTLICLPYNLLILVCDCFLILFGLFAYIGCVVKDYLMLTYSSALLLLMVVPNSIVTATSFINSGFLQIVCFLKCNVKHVCKLIAEKYNSCSYDAVIGFLCIMLFCFTCYRLPKLLRNCHIRFALPSLILKVPLILRQILTKMTKGVAYYWTSFTRSRSRKPHVDASCGNSLSPECLQEQLTRELENKLCVVCQDSPKSIILLPCRHVCVCHACRMTLLQNGSTCPMCRTHVQESMHVFL